MNTIRVLKHGVCATIQDQGRPEFQHLGVVSGGACDRYALGLANRLVGNPADAAAIEVTLWGDAFSFDKETLVSVTGGDLTAVAERDGNAAEQAIPLDRPVLLHPGTTLRFRGCRTGCRAYLAVAGGIDVPRVLGSRSTYLRAAVGGKDGRALRASDVIPIGELTESHLKISERLTYLPRDVAIVGDQFIAPRWSAMMRSGTEHDVTCLRVLRGSHFKYLSESQRQQLWSDSFQVSEQSDRMGYRLRGPKLQLDGAEEMLSAGLMPGTLQLPGDGQVILIMADGAPTGGYPRVAHVISADLPIAAQVRPGQRICFREVDLATAHRELASQTSALRRLELWMALWIK